MTETTDRTRTDLYGRALKAVSEQPWALHPEFLEDTIAALRAGMDGEDTDGRLEARRAGGTRAARGGAVAVLPVLGRITPRPRGGLLGMLLGGTSIQELRSTLRELMADEQVGSIVLDVDSPGGSVDGTPELADEISAASQRKPIVAVADTWAASGAYWLASQASRVLVSPSGQVGSIGVYATHIDYTAWNAQKGLKYTIVSAGRYKVEGHPDLPLSDEGRTHMQRMVDSYYDMFVSAVARGRDVSDETVREQFGQGRMVMARQAVEFGMADEVGTVDDAITAAADLAGSRVAQAALSKRLGEPAVRDWLRDRHQEGTSSGDGHSSPSDSDNDPGGA